MSARTCLISIRQEHCSVSIDSNILHIKRRPFKNCANFSPQNSSCLSSYRNSKKEKVRLSPLYDSTFYRTTTRDDASSSRRFVQTNETVHCTARIQRVTGNKYRRNERIKRISAVIDELKLFHAQFQTNWQKGSIAPLRNKTHRLTSVDVASFYLRVRGLIHLCSKITREKYGKIWLINLYYWFPDFNISWLNKRTLI